MGSEGSAGIIAEESIKGCAAGSVGGSIGVVADNERKKYTYKGKEYTDSKQNKRNESAKKSKE